MSNEKKSVLTAGASKRPFQRRAERGSCKAGSTQHSFTKERRQTFLDHFAASCNARAAARAAGVSKNTVYRWRIKDPNFLAAWDVALREGYAALEAELVRSATESLRVRPDAAVAVKVGTMDAKTALLVLEVYRRSIGRGPGEVRPYHYDIEGVRRRLEAKMKALRMIDAEGRPIPPPPAGAASLPAPDHSDESAGSDQSAASDPEEP